MNNIPLNITIDQINQILKALVQEPYQEVYRLIPEIKRQTEEVLRKAQEADDG